MKSYAHTIDRKREAVTDFFLIESKRISDSFRQIIYIFTLDGGGYFLFIVLKEQQQN